MRRWRLNSKPQRWTFHLKIAHRLPKLRIGDTNPDLSATPLALVSFIELLARVPHTPEEKKKRWHFFFSIPFRVCEGWKRVHSMRIMSRCRVLFEIFHTRRNEWMEHDRGSREKNGFHYQLGPLISRWVHFWPELISLRVNLFIPLWRKREQVKKGTKLKKNILKFFLKVTGEDSTASAIE